MKKQLFFLSLWLCCTLPFAACADNEKIFDINLNKNLSIVIKEVYISNTTHPFPNGDIVFGATKQPKSYIKEIIFKAYDKKYILDSKYMYNAWHNRPKEIPKVIKYIDAHCYNPGTCTIRGLFSDAGGSFVAEWMIINGKSIRTIITNSGDIINKFSTDISPPVYE